MTDGKDIINVLVVGEKQPWGAAFRRSASEAIALHVKTLARSPISEFTNETVVLVADHFTSPRNVSTE